MTVKLKNILVGIFLVGFVGLLAAFNAAKPRVLVLHAGSEESAWVQGVDRGIDVALAGNRRPILVERHYLRLDRLARPEARVAAAAEARRAVERLDPDVLLAVDDESNEAVARAYAARGRPRIVYVSIDQPPARYGYAGMATATGIVEELPLAAVRDAVTAIRGGQAARVAAIGVDNDTGRAERSQVDAFDWSPHRLVWSEIAGDFLAWRRFVESSSAKADVLLVLSAAGLPRGPGSTETVAGYEIVPWVEAHARPVPIGLHAGYVAAGGGFAIFPAAGDYGRRAMAMALEWLDEARGPPPPPMTSAHFDVAIEPARLAARGVEVPEIYVEAARAGGRLVGPPRAVPGRATPETSRPRP